MLLAALLFPACAAAPVAPSGPSGALVKVFPSDYPEFKDPGQAALAEAVGYSLQYIEKIPPGGTLRFGPETRTAAEVSASLKAFRDFLITAPPPDAVAKFVKENFDMYLAAGQGGDGGVLYTGYYTPELMASGSPDEVYRFPLYAVPDDLVTCDLGLFRDRFKGEKLSGMVRGGVFVPYYTRREIDGDGRLSGRGLEVAWCPDSIDVFFLHVQGSGMLVYPDGKKMHVNYAGSNGRPYRSVGKLLIEQGKAGLREMSLDFIKRYLRDNPEDGSDTLYYNESYVFFRIEDEGPYGCLGVPVTPERTIATDSALFPPGALCYIVTEIPVVSGHNELKGWKPYSRFVMNQDTGGAIKGPGRADVYFGYGELAELRAGYMRREGKLYFLAPLKASR